MDTDGAIFTVLHDFAGGPGEYKVYEVTAGNSVNITANVTNRQGDKYAVALQGLDLVGINGGNLVFTSDSTWEDRNNISYQ